MRIIKNFVVIFATRIGLDFELTAYFTSVHFSSGIILFITVWRIDPLVEFCTGGCEEKSYNAPLKVGF
jgi:hypothetical protein